MKTYTPHSIRKDLNYTWEPKYVFTNVYGLARSLFALSTLFVLLFTDISELIPEDFYNEAIFFPQSKLNFFLFFDYNHLYVAKIISCVIFIWVISGIFPQITGILHFWATFSVFNSVMIVEGGDQIASIVTFFLIPITLFDKRLSHWSYKEYFSYKRSNIISYFCYTCIIIIQIQAAVLYLDAGIEKLKVDEWIDGTATYYWFNHNIFGAPSWLKFCFGWIFKYSFSVIIITWGVICLEILLFAAFFMDQRKKNIMFVLGVFFHFLIFLTHGLPSFALSMYGLLIIYLLPSYRFFTISNSNSYISWRA